MTARLADALAALEAAYPPALAQGWDAVGLVSGDPADKVSSVLVAVDPVVETVDEALDLGAQLLVTHHPLLLRGVHGVGADTPKGALVHRLIRQAARCSPRTPTPTPPTPASPTRWPRARPGGGGPAGTGPEAPLDKIVTFIPVGPAITAVHDALRRPPGRSATTATARSPPRAPPVDRRDLTIGGREAAGGGDEAGDGAAARAAGRGRRRPARRATHEEPVDVLELADLPSARGLGRIGTLPAPEPLHAFADRVAAALPPTAWGRRPRATRPADPPSRGCGARATPRCAAAGRRRRLRHRGPAPPPGVGDLARGRSGAGRRRPLGVGVALVRAGGRRPARGAGR